MRVWFKAIAVISLLLLAPAANATPIIQTLGPFDVTFYNAGDSDGLYTGSQNWTPEQITDVAASIDAWASNIDENPIRNVNMHLFWDELDSLGSNVLGGSASVRITDYSSQWNLGEYVWKNPLDILEDPGTSSYGFDTVIRYDVTAADTNWNFGSDAPGAGDIDFRSVITHEIGHSLGFDSTYESPTYDDWGWFYTSQTQGEYYGLSEWDQHLVDSAGNKPENGTTGTPDNFNETDDPVYFDGPNAMAVYGGLVPIYAPNPYQPGSSLSHIDQATFPNYLMSPAISTGSMNRMPSELEWAIMQDIGWNLTPEPATILLLAIPAVVLATKRKTR
ncbi:hypothetical protein ACFL3G_10915 [Planctomycetota bacterium]